MRDPLQTTVSPHELLQVESGADRKAIDKAYMLALQKKTADPATIKLARDSLLDPVARIEHELLLYHARAFDGVRPSPFADHSILQPNKRAATAKAWELHLRQNGANIWIAHALAVQAYWCALHNEQRVLKSIRNGWSCYEPGTADVMAEDAILGLDARDAQLNDLHQKWLTVIGYWGLVASTPRFWAGIEGVNEQQRSALREKFVTRLLNKIRDVGRAFASESGSDSLARRFASLEHSLTTELSTAREVGDVGMLILGGERCFGGPLLFQQLGIIASAHHMFEQKALRLTDRIEQLREALKDHDKNPEAQRNHVKIRNQLKNDSQQLWRVTTLRRLFSPYRRIDTLIDESPSTALDEIDSLPESEKNFPEVACLRARALHAVGRQLAELHKFDDALVKWQEARQHRRQKDTDALIVSDVVSTCLTTAAELDAKQLNRAIDILDRGLHIVRDNENLKTGLADRLVRRGMETINGAQEGASDAMNESRLKSIRAAFKKGLVDLDRAASLGSKQAKRLASEARSVLESLKPVPVWVQKANDAAKAAAAENWNSAVNLLRQAIADAGQQAPDDLKQNLAVCLTNRGIQKANRAISDMQNTSPNAGVMQLISRLQQNCHEGGCAMCMKSQYSSRESWYSFALPDGRSASICSGCIDTVRNAVQSSTGPRDSVISALKSAEADLSEALRLDKSNNHARQNLSELRELLSKLQKESDSAQDPKRPASQNSKERSPYHAVAMLIGIIWAIAQSQPFEPWFSDDIAPIQQLWANGISGKLTAVFASVIAFPCFVPFLFGSFAGFKMAWEAICKKKWAYKRGVERSYEIVLYLYVVMSILTSVIHRS